MCLVGSGISLTAVIGSVTLGFSFLISGCKGSSTCAEKPSSNCLVIPEMWITFTEGCTVWLKRLSTTQLEVSSLRERRGPRIVQCTSCTTVQGSLALRIFMQKSRTEVLWSYQYLCSLLLLFSGPSVSGNHPPHFRDKETGGLLMSTAARTEQCCSLRLEPPWSRWELLPLGLDGVFVDKRKDLVGRPAIPPYWNLLPSATVSLGLGPEQLFSDTGQMPQSRSTHSLQDQAGH